MVQDVEVFLTAAGAVGGVGVTIAGKVISALWGDLRSERAHNRDVNTDLLERVIAANAAAAVAMKDLTEWVKKERAG